MKRAKDIFDKVISMENLERACQHAMKGKKKRRAVIRFMKDKDSKLQLLHELLKSGEYHPLPYTKKNILDRCTSKVREICVPKFYPDQIV